eukprot:TRINITY_DN1902_c0_g2_i1.p1 TRINITY_DN1902_c0_g2~~TRINITY_DN1902_c0_g2_i1.p1  ORF type:complete len:287 (+),score=122.67 TRINITY_DN1902_c0_g2_i1:86-946(+)
MARSQKSLIFIAFGALAIIVGTCIMTAGGFKAVMVDPTDGPLTNTAAVANAGHYRQLILNYPEIFNCATLEDDVYSNANVEYSPYYIADADVRDNAKAYCRFHDGEQAWTFALYLPLTLVMIALAVTALIRQSGFTLGLVGVGLSAVMLAFTLVTLAHYQAHSYVPQALNAFTDCDGLSAVSKATTTGIATTGAASSFANSLNGPSPRRGWICENDWDYDSDLNTASNLVYGGAAVSFVAYLSLLISFAYIVQPFVTPIPAFTKAASFRGADVDFDQSYTYTDEEY